MSEKPLKTSRGYRLSLLAMGLGFAIILLGFVLALLGKLSGDFVTLGLGFGAVASVSVGGSHATNVAERRRAYRPPEPPRRYRDDPLDGAP